MIRQRHDGPAAVETEPPSIPNLTVRKPVVGDHIKLTDGTPATILEVLPDGSLRVETREIMDRAHVPSMGVYARPETSRAKWAFRGPDGRALANGRARNQPPPAPTPPPDDASAFQRHQYELDVARHQEECETVVEPLAIGREVLFFENIPRKFGAIVTPRLEACSATVTRIYPDDGCLDLTISIPVETTVGAGQWGWPEK